MRPVVGRAVVGRSDSRTSEPEDDQTGARAARWSQPLISRPANRTDPGETLAHGTPAFYRRPAAGSSVSCWIRSVGGIGFLSLASVGGTCCADTATRAGGHRRLVAPRISTSSMTCARGTARVQAPWTRPRTRRTATGSAGDGSGANSRLHDTSERKVGSQGQVLGTANPGYRTFTVKIASMPIPNREIRCRLDFHLLQLSLCGPTLRPLEASRPISSLLTFLSYYDEEPNTGRA